MEGKEPIKIRLSIAILICIILILIGVIIVFAINYNNLKNDKQQGETQIPSLTSQNNDISITNASDIENTETKDEKQEYIGVYESQNGEKVEIVADEKGDLYIEYDNNNNYKLDLSKKEENGAIKAYDSNDDTDRFFIFIYPKGVNLKLPENEGDIESNYKPTDNSKIRILLKGSSQSLLNEVYYKMDSAKEEGYTEITEELSENSIFVVKQTKKLNGKITLRGSIYETPYIISASEINECLKKGMMTVKNLGEGIEYLLRKNLYIDSSAEYVLYAKENEGQDTEWIPEYFIFKKDSGTYYLENGTQFLDEYKLKEDNKEITVDANTKCVYYCPTPNSDTDEKTDTVENVFSKDLSWCNRFNFKFKDGKCIEVHEVVINND